MPNISFISSAEIKLSVLYIINLLPSVLFFHNTFGLKISLLLNSDEKILNLWKSGYVFGKVTSFMDIRNYSKICSLIKLLSQKCTISVLRRHKKSPKPLILLGFGLLRNYSISTDNTVFCVFLIPVIPYMVWSFHRFRVFQNFLGIFATILRPGTCIILINFLISLCILGLILRGYPIPIFIRSYPINITILP